MRTSSGGASLLGPAYQVTPDPEEVWKPLAWWLRVWSLTILVQILTWIYLLALWLRARHLTPSMSRISHTGLWWGLNGLKNSEQRLGPHKHRGGFCCYSLFSSSPCWPPVSLVCADACVCSQVIPPLLRRWGSPCTIHQYFSTMCSLWVWVF